jgi:mannosyltransferase OCH1-like enzyme
MIPKIIHQIWIGPKPIPYEYINTIKNMNHDYEHILWTEEEFKKRHMYFKCQNQIDLIDELCGKADIMRVEILNRYGGIYIDADTIAIERIDDKFLQNDAFAGFENEIKIKNLVGNSTMGFTKNHIILQNMIDYFLKNINTKSDINKEIWKLTGPLLFTNIINNFPKTIRLYPDHYFYPIHHTGETYKAHGKIYLCQLWNSTNIKYNMMNLYQILKKPYISISILILVYNTEKQYLYECFESILKQNGKIFFEIIIINNGSNEETKNNLIELTNIFCKNTINSIWKLYNLDENLGIGNILKYGIEKCSNELIIKLDSDDIMMPDKIESEVQFMLNHPEAQICGSQYIEFKMENDKRILLNETNYKTITWENLKINKYKNFINYNCCIYRKLAILSVGNYINAHTDIPEDIYLILCILKKYGIIYNIPNINLYYRGYTKNSNFSEKLDKYIEEFIKD